MTHDTNTTPSSAPDAREDTAALLAAWWDELTAALGLADVPVERDALLSLAGDAAHGVVRPAAPLTTFLAGYAAGLQGGDREALDAAVRTSLEAIRMRTHES
ncbi:MULTISPECIES: DUF6457 domain-containing protein [unclassified Rathayibacter]|uniref:DUF6457 domain-containing protein n=1 Tax=unclassified Rathayibacter TaxID=2609250 RepID=UPI000F4B8646|nr:MULTISPECIES: DUF6457 domain-containing protein [unclassified Rathayibacter]ROP43593.1 hypothetical protein EDF45_4075 [Rathayibacter sp. PhB186]ROS46757.1 hypothetical protein EDF44_3892 [Rathayibacter sp. PhB185]